MFIRNALNSLQEFRARRLDAEVAPLAASIRRYPDAVRTKFSNGKISWFSKQPNVSDAAFIGAVIDWAKRHGAQTIVIESD